MNLVQPIALIVLSVNTKNIERKIIEDNLEKTLEEINVQLEKHEKIKKIILIKDPWTTENNILTPTMKIKRGEIDSIYEEKYLNWYDSQETIIWE